jgi:hypothetical protein
MKFRKKPIVIEAIEFKDAGSYGTMLAVFGDEFANSTNYHMHRDQMAIQTLEGVMNAIPGDWIIKGIKGEFYPCKPNIFAATYEPAE